MSYSAYTKTQNRTTESPRDVEYRLLGAATAALLEAEENTDNVVKRVEAVCWNRDIWGTLRVDLSHPDNRLPAGLKNELITLARWVDKETFRILSGDTNELDGLIEVNKNIMTGLKSAAQNRAAADTAADADKSV